MQEDREQWGLGHAEKHSLAPRGQPPPSPANCPRIQLQLDLPIGQKKLEIWSFKQSIMFLSVMQQFSKI